MHHALVFDPAPEVAHVTLELELAFKQTCSNSVLLVQPAPVRADYTEPDLFLFLFGQHFLLLLLERHGVDVAVVVV